MTAIRNTDTAGVTAIDTITTVNDITGPRSLFWTGALGTDFGTAGNWDDITNSLTPAASPPLSEDAAEFDANAGTISGSGSVGRLMVFGTAAFSGSVQASILELDSGAVTIQPGATLAFTTFSFIGDLGVGNVTIQAGGTLQSETFSGFSSTLLAAGVGERSGFAGSSVTVTGAGATWDLNGRFGIGVFGGGTLDILNGGTVKTSVTPQTVTTNGTISAEYASVSFGNSTGVTGTGLVMGSGSTLDAGGGAIFVGNEGTGSLTVSQGGSVTDGTPDVNLGATEIGLNGGTGTLSVTDPGSTFTSVGDLEWNGMEWNGMQVSGGSGAGLSTDNIGYVFVENGATVISGFATIDPRGGFDVGDGAGGTGFVTVDGAGSLINNNGRFDVGRSGTGTMTIQNKALVTTELTAAAIAAGQSAAIIIGANVGSTGLLTVTGAGSALSTTQNMAVGENGTGTLAVANGGTVTIGTNTVIGSGVTADGQGTVTVDGAGSTLSIGGDLVIGTTSGSVTSTGTLTITDGGAVGVAGSITLTDIGTLTNAGTLTEGGTLSDGGVFTNETTLSGNATLTASGILTNLAGAMVTGAVITTAASETISNLGTVDGAVSLAGGDRLVTGIGAVFNGAITGGTGGNTLEIATGPYALTNFDAPGTPQYTTLQIDNGVTVTTDVSDVLTGVTLINNGVLNLGAFESTAPVQNSGEITGDVTLASGVPLINAAGGTISGAGLAVIEALGPASVMNAGVIDPAMYGVDLIAGGSVTNVAGGTIDGTVAGVLIAGGAGTVTNGGLISGGGIDAVTLAAGFANRVILDPGFAFTGLVDGGNAIGASPSSALELASMPVQGTLIGFGAGFVNFAQVQVDQGASWTLGGANTLAAGTTLTDQGALLLNGTGLTGGGSVTVDGTAGLPASIAVMGGGSWSGTSNFVIGGAGAAALLVDSAGDISAAGVEVARSAGSSGSITVVGAKSLLINTGSFAVGDAGLGSLSIAAGGAVTTTADAIIANTTSASGSSVNVTGAGSDLTVAGTLVVGAAGFGSLSLSQGAAVTAAALDVAAGATGDGAVSLAGTGTTLTVSGALTLGDQAAGDLSILGGAQMTIGGGLVGGASGAGGNLDIEGNGSQLTINGGTLVVGGDGPAEFTLGIGATLTGELSTDLFGVTNEYGNVDPATDPNDGTQNVGFGNSLIYDFFIANSGTVKITSGTATFYTPLATFETGAKDKSVNGLWQIGASETLVMNATSVDNSQTFDLTSAGGATLVIGQVPAGNPNNPDTFNGQTMPTLTGSIAPGAANVLPGWDAPIENYASGDVITLRGLTYGSATASGDVVTVWSGPAGTGNDLGSLTFIDKGGNTDSVAAVAQAALAAAQINAVACFAAGTRIGTVDGWRKVEDLAVGDDVRTVLGGSGRVVWIGSRAVDCARHPDPETVWPVRISAGAFGENVPARDLYLSPDHAVFVNEVLVPAKLLVNGSSITQVKRNQVVYHHVELEQHDVVLAEGLAVESYLDTGDRANFAGSGTIRLYPDFAARPDAASAWEMKGAAPLVMTGKALDAARRSIAATRYGAPTVSGRDARLSPSRRMRSLESLPVTAVR